MFSQASNLEIPSMYTGLSKGRKGFDNITVLFLEPFRVEHHRHMYNYCPHTLTAFLPQYYICCGYVIVKGSCLKLFKWQYAMLGKLRIM